MGDVGPALLEHDGSTFYTIRDYKSDYHEQLGVITTEQLFRNKVDGAAYEFPCEGVIFNYCYHQGTCLNRALHSPAARSTLEKYTLIVHEDVKKTCRVPVWELHDSQREKENWTPDTPLDDDWAILPSRDSFHGNSALFSNAWHLSECTLAGTTIDKKPKWQSYVRVMRAGLFHPKIYILRFSRTLRVIISSRNLEGGTEKDVCWAVDLPLAPDGAGGLGSWYSQKLRAKCSFIKPLDDFFVKTTNHSIAARIRDIFRGVDPSARLTPDSSTKVSFVASYAHLNRVNTIRSGLHALQEAIRLTNWKGDWPEPEEEGATGKLHITTCFVGHCLSSKSSWWPDLLEVCGVNEKHTELVFPCWRDVYSCDTIGGFSALHLFLEKENATDWRHHMPFLRRTTGMRDKTALYHIKMMTRLPSPRVLDELLSGKSDTTASAEDGAIGWVCLGSHNCSDAAWGSLESDSKNVEASVVLSTSSPLLVQDWQARHPFDFKRTHPYGVENRHKHDDGPYTWGRAPFKFAGDIRYRFDDDKGGVECVDALNKRKLSFLKSKSRRYWSPNGNGGGGGGVGVSVGAAGGSASSSQRTDDGSADTDDENNDDKILKDLEVSIAAAAAARKARQRNGRYEPESDDGDYDWE